MSGADSATLGVSPDGDSLMGLGFWAVAAGLTFGLPVGAAHAAFVKVTETGSVLSANKVGYFGEIAPGTAYTSTYVFDTSLGETASGKFSSDSFGGEMYSTKSPNIRASLTINGLTYAFVGDSYGQTSTYNDGSMFEFVDRAESSTETLISDFYRYGIANSAPSASESEFTYNIERTGATFINYFQVLSGEPGVDAYSINLTPEVLSRAIVPDLPSPVPLPSSAPMFGAALLGLAGLGYAAKRKKGPAAA